MSSIRKSDAAADGERVPGHMVLTGADRDAFLAAIDREPDPAPRLVEALKRHRQLFG